MVARAGIATWSTCRHDSIGRNPFCTPPCPPGEPFRLCRDIDRNDCKITNMILKCLEEKKNTDAEKSRITEMCCRGERNFHFQPLQAAAAKEWTFLPTLLLLARWLMRRRDSLQTRSAAMDDESFKVMHFLHATVRSSSSQLDRYLRPSPCWVSGNGNRARTSCRVGFTFLAVSLRAPSWWIGNGFLLVHRMF